MSIKYKKTTFNFYFFVSHYAFSINRLGLSRRAGSVLQDEPEPLSSRLDLRSSRGNYVVSLFTY